MPSDWPSARPSMHPSIEPTDQPSEIPMAMPSDLPTSMPTSQPSPSPTAFPTPIPTRRPSKAPTTHPTRFPTTVPSDLPTAAPTDIPSAMPSTAPTQMPTISCGLREFRPSTSAACEQCPVGTYWNQTYETTKCDDCPSDQTSLVGATTCYTPCPLNSALNAETLVCVPIPAELQKQVMDSGLNVTLNDSLVILVSLAVPLDNVLLSVAETNMSSNVSTVIAINNGSYGLCTTPTILSGQIILVGGQQQQFQTFNSSTGRRLLNAEVVDLEAERRRLVQKHYPHFQHRRSHRRLSVVGHIYSIIEAPADTRCIIFIGGNLQTDLIVFTGTPSAQYAGGVEVSGSASQATFSRTDFLSNRWSTQGGGLTVTGGAKVTLGKWCDFELQ